MRQEELDAPVHRVVEVVRSKQGRLQSYSSRREGRDSERLRGYDGHNAMYGAVPELPVEPVAVGAVWRSNLVLRMRRAAKVSEHPVAFATQAAPALATLGRALSSVTACRSQEVVHSQRDRPRRGAGFPDASGRPLD